MQRRIIVFAPHGRDAEAIVRVLSENDFACRVVTDIAGLLSKIDEGAEAAIIAEEALANLDVFQLFDWLQQQAPWSDFPFVILMSQRAEARQRHVTDKLGELGNAVLLERPVSTATLKSAAIASLRGRYRQYQARDIMAESTQTGERLRASQAELLSLNEHLEARIHERTIALAQANDRLMNEGAERERVRKALLQFQKIEAIGQLTGGIAHDFNNLLNVIQGNLDLILHFTKDENIRRRAEIARKTCQRGAKLTSQLLSFSRNQTLDLAPIAIAAMFDDIHEMVLSSLGGVALQMSVDSDSCVVLADRNQLEMALLNLAINARDAMPDGGTVTFCARRSTARPDFLAQGEYGVISVTDTGTGIPSSILEKVFDPFFTTKEVGKGTGLGLSQVYGMAQQSGGTAQVFSSAAGTVVEIWLPLTNAIRVEPASPVSLQNAKPEAWAHSILVVEDDGAVRHAMVEMLEVLGYQVRQAESATVALDMLQNALPSLMITDYLMPGMTGAQLVAQVEIDYPRLPVIMVTGYADMHAIERVIGQNTVLRKPFNIQDLAASVVNRIGQPG
ncbi:MAG: response regulator [Telluria sp.]